MKGKFVWPWHVPESLWRDLEMGTLVWEGAVSALGSLWVQMALPT